MMRGAIKTSADLTPRERDLVGRMSELRFGKLEEIPIRDGEALVERAIVIRDMKLGGRLEDEDFEAPRDHFTLKRPVVELIETLRGLRSGLIRKIEVRSGLPVFLQVQEAADGARGKL